MGRCRPPRSHGGNEARDWELAILKMLMASDAVVGSTDVAGVFDGYTEAWMASFHPASSLSDLIEKVRCLDEVVHQGDEGTAAGRLGFRDGP